jgi:hypothetical protein
MNESFLEGVDLGIDTSTSMYEYSYAETIFEKAGGRVGDWQWQTADEETRNILT